MMGLDITVCPRCNMDLINLLHCHYCNWPKSRSEIKGVADDDQVPLNKVPDSLLNQEPNDNLKGIFDMKYFLFHINGHTMYSDGPFTDKEDAIKYVQDNLDIDIPTQDIILIEGERINLKRIVVEG